MSKPQSGSMLGIWSDWMDVVETLSRTVKTPPPPQAKPAKELLSFREAAKRLGVDRATLPALVASGQLRVVEVNGRARIPVAELERISQEGFEVSRKAPKKRRGKSSPARSSPTAEAERIRKLKF